MWKNSGIIASGRYAWYYDVDDRWGKISKEPNSLRSCSYVIINRHSHGYDSVSQLFSRASYIADWLSDNKQTTRSLWINSHSSSVFLRWWWLWQRVWVCPFSLMSANRRCLSARHWACWSMIEWKKKKKKMPFWMNFSFLLTRGSRRRSHIQTYTGGKMTCLNTDTFNMQFA